MNISYHVEILTKPAGLTEASELHGMWNLDSFQRLG